MQRIDVVAIVLSIGLFVMIVELVRLRTLSERYSLLWLLTGFVLIVLSIWRRALVFVAKTLGIYYAPSALMLVALGFELAILLHFSQVLSRLTEKNKHLAQQHAILTWRVAELEKEFDATSPTSEAHDRTA
jgi:hypothetical protein